MANKIERNWRVIGRNGISKDVPETAELQKAVEDWGAQGVQVLSGMSAGLADHVIDPDGNKHALNA